MYILDRHHVWRSHDPMSVQTFDFCEEKKMIHTPFFILHFLVQIHLNSSNLTQLDSIWIRLSAWLSVRLFIQLSAQLSTQLSAQLFSWLSIQLS